MSVERIATVEKFERCLAESAAQPVLLLKHSTAWPVSAGARVEFLEFAGQGGARCVEVLVREDRALSLAVAERTGVRHESPQVICLVGGRAAAHASHRDITRESLRRMLPAGRWVAAAPGVESGMKIAIEYCGVWNYRPQAARLAAAIERETGKAVELREGTGGVFTLSIDGRSLFERRKAGRFPTEGEAVALVRRWTESLAEWPLPGRCEQTHNPQVNPQCSFRLNP